GAFLQKATICSTEKMVAFCKNAPVKDIIVVTESGMLHRLRKECPDKNLIPGPTDRGAGATCRSMTRTPSRSLPDGLTPPRPPGGMGESVRFAAGVPLLGLVEPPS